MSHVDVGFLEKTESILLKSHYFPSKIGGKPSWLDLKDLPKSEDLKCELCEKPLIFLTQIYAPYEDDPSNFHRTIFLFICRNAECCKRNENKNIKVWRSQLKRENEFYSSEPPKEDEKIDFDLEKFLNLCYVCGCPSSKHCGKCKVTSYCSREHQVADWKSGHKNNCGNPYSETTNNILYEEFELVIEEEVLEEKKEVDEQKTMEEYEKLVSEGKAGTMTDVSEEDLQNHASVDEDKFFSRFRKRINNNPDQVLRYDRGGEPILIAAEPKPNDIPNCEYCGSERRFEFQILPQLLFSLHEDTLDWGTLMIYSCKKSCLEGPSYKREYVFKQDVAE